MTGQDLNNDCGKKFQTKRLVSNFDLYDDPKIYIFMHFYKKNLSSDMRSTALSFLSG